MRPRKPSGSIISFRLSSSLAEALTAEAKKFGISPHEMARQFVLERLLDESEEPLADSIAELRHEFQKLRSDLKHAVVALLCDAGKLELTDAETWVNSRLFE